MNSKVMRDAMFTMKGGTANVDGGHATPKAHATCAACGSSGPGNTPSGVDIPARVLLAMSEIAK